MPPFLPAGLVARPPGPQFSVAATDSFQDSFPGKGIGNKQAVHLEEKPSIFAEGNELGHWLGEEVTSFVSSLEIGLPILVGSLHGDL